MLEPLIEVEVNGERIAYGPICIEDVADLFKADFLKGGDHKLKLGKVSDIPYLKNQDRWTFKRCGLIDPVSIHDYCSNGGFDGFTVATKMSAAKIIEEIKKNFGEIYDLNDEILKFLATEITSSIREMVGALNRVLAFSKINTKSPTIYECKKILKDFINCNVKSINVETIQNIVAAHFNLNIQEMLSARRSRSLARPRQIAMYLAKQHTSNSLPDIGKKFSNRDHTTVIHAVKKIEELMKKDDEIRQSVAEIKKRIL